MKPTKEQAETFLLPYLTTERREGFLKSLTDFQSLNAYFAKIADPEPLQGDAWHGFTVFRFEDGSREVIKGIVLTNSCDLAGGNERYFPPSLTFAPLIPLQVYERVLKEKMGDDTRIANHLRDVRAQKVSSHYFLPDLAGVGDCFALLSDAYSMPLEHFSEKNGAHRLASLSQVAFWLLLFKLSFHYCRFHEGIDRDAVPA